MKSSTILLIFFCVFYSIQFGSSKNFNCNFYLLSNLFKFNCECSNDCHKMVYNSVGIECGLFTTTYDQIDDIKFVNCNLSQINSLQITKFPWVERLSPGYNIDMTIIGRTMLKHFKNLTELYVHINSTELIENTFANLTELRKLDLSYNTLSTINERAFNGLYKLKHLFLFQNKITIIHKNVFKDLTNLKILDLRFNSIEQLVPETFSSLTKLEELFLLENWLQKFNFNLVSPMRYTLQKLSIDYNQLTELEISNNLHFTALTELSIGGNKFDCCQLLRFFNSTEGKALANIVSKSVYGVKCDGNRQLNPNGHNPNISCENKSNDSTETIDKNSNATIINRNNYIILLFILVLNLMSKMATPMV